MNSENGALKQLFAGRVVVPLLLAIVFITDLGTQLGFAHGILYLPALILVMQYMPERKTYQLFVLLISLVGVALGYFLAPEPAEGFPRYYVVANRILSAGILIFSYVALRRYLLIQGKFIDAEKEEERQRADLKYFIEAMPIQVWSANPQGEVDFVGERLESFSGKSQKEILADWPSLLHPDDRDRTLDVWSKSVNSGEPYRIDFRLLRHDGAYIWFQTQATAQTDARGNIKRWLGSSIDIDDLRRLQQQSELLAEKFQHTVESITDAFFTLDKGFRFTYINQKAADLFGVDAPDYLGAEIWSLYPGGYDDRFAHRYRQAAQTGQKLHFEEYFEPRGLWLAVHVYPSKEGLTVFFNDVTVQRREQEQLRLLRTAVSRLNDIVLITEAEPIDEPGPVTVFVNEAFERRTGYKPEEVIGKTPRILQGPKTDRAELDRIRRALQKWEPVRAQLINYTKSGEEFWLELDIVPIPNESGWFTHWVAVERDITEQKRMQEHLAASQKMESIGQLTGGMSHDFNNLLTVIQGNAELLQEELADDEKLASLANLICQAADKGAGLTRNLLAFARKQPLAPQAVALKRLLSGMQPIVKTSLGEQIVFELDIPDRLWPVFIDASRLENAILNLAINARDAMPKGGTVKVSAMNYPVNESDRSKLLDLSPGDYVQISFTDDGDGIPADLQASIFEPFFSTKSEAKGSGLGLSTIYGFLKQSQGLITVYSEEGKGTTFNLYLPCATHQPDIRPLEKTSAAHVSRSQGALILLVEDNPEIRVLGETILGNQGFQVVSAVSGDEALKLLESGLKPDLLFTDVVMPGTLSGPELANLAVERIPGLRVILTSGFADMESLDSPDGFEHTLLSKPYRSDELIQLVRSLLGSEWQ